MPEPGNPQSLNRYSYVLGNPLKYRDPSGHMHWQGDGGGEPWSALAQYRAGPEHLWSPEVVAYAQENVRDFTAVDKWDIDIIYSGSQKCLSCPPGISPVSISEKAVEILNNRSTKVPNWYLDLAMIINYWEGSKRSYHHTAPINMIYALHQGLYNLLEEGLQNAFRRHRKNHNKLVAGLEEMGLSMFVEPEYRLPMLNAVIVPEGIDEATVRSRLRKEFRIEIGAGLGPMAGKVWRIGLMGESSREENVDRILSSLGKIL